MRLSTFLSPSLVAALVVLTVWHLVTQTQLIPPYLLPGPFAIAHSLWHNQALLLWHALGSLTTAVAGFGVALISAIGCACLIQLFPLARRVLYPWLVALQAIPVIFLFPLFLLWFGFGWAPRILVVALVCVFPMVMNLVDAMHRCNPDLLYALESMGAKKWQLVIRVRFMNALPQLFSGVRLAITYCVIGAVIAEWLGASRGLGVYMLRSYQSFSTAQVFAAIVLIVLLTLALVSLVRLAERILLPWQHKRI